ncbi:HAD family hydrolase [Chamaesiphon minutus]|uniref:Haloacid dehalogenase superfamily enzyme, subfamily IA n=1 Tax=Chamaesiphon minutus (strain ATCC 27169 / PCC 6605) TaxID=1173020 RepID=K9UDA3_CHAP6|nr:HAD family hydrolase [Chamaesiphon minutus]AFY93097.1 haloacid dehalogenase superfamily enzyme, subfamily IA [Chamaesiphon minutus PCC 6605]
MSISFDLRDCWIFDMDGTLTVSIHDFDGIKRILGLPIDRPILEALNELPAAQAAQLHQQLDALELDIAHQATAQVGARELLTKLRSRGDRIGILTRNSKPNAQATLAACGLAEFFPAESILSRHCCPPKPSPDGIWQLLSSWSASPERSVMVGDYLFDLEAGRRAGSATVYLDPTGEFPWQDRADLPITTLAQIIAML